MKVPNSSICPVCHSGSDIVTLEKRGPVPTLQNTTLATLDDALEYPTGDLDIQWCAGCGFVWNAAFNPEIILYDAEYNNDVSTSHYYRQHIEKMADKVLASIPAGEKLHYLEIGCGEGDFLRLIVEKAGDRCASATAFDPSFSNPEQLPGMAVVHREFFTPENVDKIQPDTNVVCSRHTIEHVPDVQLFGDALAAPLQRDGVSLFVETPDVNWILKKGAFQDFFYEHCSLYTPSSIALLLAQRGLSANTEAVYNEQYMWTHATRTSTMISTEGQKILKTHADHFLEYRNAEFLRWSKLMLTRKPAGPIAIWGAASKGVTFSLLFAQQGHSTIDMAIDLNKLKQGRFLPVTGIKCVSPNEAQRLGVATIIIMNPNYDVEIRSMVQEMDWQAEVFTLNGPE